MKQTEFNKKIARKIQMHLFPNKIIYESPDGGRTVFARITGLPEQDYKILMEKIRGQS
jgi:hypothetical protein